jgi:hypothetical protein
MKVMELMKLMMVCAIWAIGGSNVDTKTWAQTGSTGAVIGAVTDSTGAVVPDAQVTVVNEGTGEVRKQNTGTSGLYRVLLLAPGSYRIKVSKSGFKLAIRPGVPVIVGEVVQLDVELEVGARAERVVVQPLPMTALQTTDSSVGEVLSGTQLNRMPILGRSAAQLIFLQPAVAPNDPQNSAGSGDIGGGQIAGARSEQVTFTVDGGDATSDLDGSNQYVSPDRESPAVSPVVPVPQDSVEEFRVTTNNANSTFGRSSGGQVSFITKSGTNTLHGALYEYHDDDGLNANSWSNDLLNITKPPSVDNRFGAALGGPIIKNKFFYYAFYEGRRFHDNTQFERIVPTDTLKKGILQVGGVSYNLNPANGPLAANCGPAQNLPCDPRGIGVSPVIMAQLALYPTGNDPSQNDGPTTATSNVTGYTLPVATPITTNVSKLKFNYLLNSKWSALATWQYSSTQRTGTDQVDILGTPKAASGDPYDANFYTFQVEGQVSSNFLAVTHGSFLRNWWGWTRTVPQPLVSGTDAALEVSGEGQGSSFGLSKLLADPINIDTHSARARVWDGHDWYIAEDMTWVHHSHTFQFGGAGYIWHDYSLRNDTSLGGLSSAPIYYIGSNQQFGDSYVNVTGITPGSLTGGDATRWGGFYAALLGMVDHSAQIETRNGSFQPNPLGTPLFDNVTIPSFTTYFQDVWKARPNLTITAGLNWGVQLVPHEQNGKEVVLTYAATDAVVDIQQYLQTRKAMLGSGQAYNPDFSLTPVNSLPTPFQGKMRVTAWTDIGPRIAAAWEVPFQNKVFGNHQTVIRGGYALVWDRTSAVNEAFAPLMGGGLAQVDQCAGPTARSSGLPLCGNVTGTNPSTAFRIGVDGASVPIPSPVAQSIPLTPPAPFGLYYSNSLDPFITPAHTHQVDFTIQRALQHNLYLELGYIGHFGRNLPQGENPNFSYYLMKDPKSGQTLAQAFDVLQKEINSASAITPQPFFENQIGPGGTATLVSTVGSFISSSDLGDTTMYGLNLLTPKFVDNMQVNHFDVQTDRGFSDYNAGYVTIRKAMSHGLQFLFNYTWSHAIGNQGVNQDDTNYSNSPYNLQLDKSAEFFDHRHNFNFSYYYELPFGKGKAFNTGSGILDRIIGGWHTAGILIYYTGSPMCINSDGNYGSSAENSCAIPTVPLPSMSVHRGVAGSNGVGTDGDPSVPGGSGINAFADPSAVFNALTHPLLSVNNRIPFDQLRTFPYWNFDASLGRNLVVTERFKVILTADAFNVFNHPIYAAPNEETGSLDIGVPSAFGVVSSAANTARQLQLGVRVEF